MLDRQSDKSFGGVFGPPVRTSFVKEWKKVSFSVEGVKTSGNCSASRDYISWNRETLQLAARQCYQIAREAGSSNDRESLPEQANAPDQ
ncbi:hypothetical protein CK203_080648 [Vitis vinifera]|uniref:Uncharacterized protein n=1 Tax=Vitis vinifera TaxID=29760 RepID=A0A438EZH9_VITVI|nr:hypothetical protein CK203_080648 [Vitis vinifera]